MRILLPLFIIISLHLFGQPTERVPLTLQHFNVEDGLSQSVVTDIVQDSDDFIWLGTQNGLNRFDGKNIKIYNTITDSTQLNSYFIKKLLVSSKQTLWVATTNGLGKYDKRTDKILSLSYLSGIPQELLQVDDVEEDAKGNLWFCSSLGLFHLDTDNYSYNQRPFISNGDTIYIYPTNLEFLDDTTIAFTNKNTIYTYTIPSKTFKKVISLESTENGSLNRIRRILAHQSKSIFIGADDGWVYQYHTDSQELHRLKIKRSPVFNDMFIESDSTILFGMDYRGLLRYNLNTETYQSFYDRNSKTKQIKKNKIRTAYIDNQNILWIGHYQSGFSFANQNPSGFHVTTSIGSKESIKVISDISALLVDSEGKTWIGTDGFGLYIDSKKTNTQSQFLRTGKTSDLPKNSVLMLYEDLDKDIWIGTYKGGLSLWEPKTKTFKTFKHNPADSTSISGNDIREMIVDDNGNYWLVVHGKGVSKFDKEHNFFTNYQSSEDDSSSLLNDWTFDITKDYKGDVWVTSARGVSMYDKTTNGFINYEYEIGNPEGLTNSIVTIAYSDSAKNLWFGTNQGLNKFNFKTKRFEHTSLQSGLDKETINSIEEGADGSLWIGTGNGLYNYNVKTKSHKRFIQNDGIHGNEFIRNSSYKTSNGILYFGGPDGITSFKSAEIEQNNKAPQIKILGIDLMGKAIDPTILHEQNITFEYNQNFLTFNFVALNYINSNKNKYRYKLIGLETEWNEITSDIKAVYTSLPPGKYTFQVIGCNNDHVWNTEGTSFQFTIQTPWWETWYFKGFIISTALFLFIVFFIYRVQTITKYSIELENEVALRTLELTTANEYLEEKSSEIEAQHEEIRTVNNTLKSTNDQLQSLVKTKDTLLSIIAHDLKNPMNTVIGFSSLLLNNTKQYDAKKINRFLGLINQSSVHAFNLLENLLTWARTQTGKIEISPEQLNIEDIIIDTINLLKQSATKKSITLEYTDSNEDFSCYADKNTVATILRNLITNAIKFTPQNGSIMISSKTKDDTLFIAIEDTGIGMSKEQVTNLFSGNSKNSTEGTDAEKGTGLGLLICKEFAEMNNGSLSVSSIESEGTTFTLTLPKANL